MARQYSSLSQSAERPAVARQNLELREAGLFPAAIIQYLLDQLGFAGVLPPQGGVEFRKHTEIGRQKIVWPLAAAGRRRAEKNNKPGSLSAACGIFAAL